MANKKTNGNVHTNGTPATPANEWRVKVGLAEMLKAA